MPPSPFPSTVFKLFLLAAYFVFWPFLRLLLCIWLWHSGLRLSDQRISAATLLSWDRHNVTWVGHPQERFKEYGTCQKVGKYELWTQCESPELHCTSCHAFLKATGFGCALYWFILIALLFTKLRCRSNTITWSCCSSGTSPNMLTVHSKVQFFLLASAIHREHFLLHCLKKEIATAKELDLRQLGKVLIFRDTHTEPSYYI